MILKPETPLCKKCRYYVTSEKDMSKLTNTKLHFIDPIDISRPAKKRILSFQFCRNSHLRTESSVVEGFLPASESLTPP